MFCINGHENPEGSTFCNTCGTALHATTTSQQAAAEPKPSTGGRRRKVLLLAGGLVVLIAAGGVTAALVLGGEDTDDTSRTSRYVEQIREANEDYEDYSVAELEEEAETFCGEFDTYGVKRYLDALVAASTQGANLSSGLLASMPPMTLWKCPEHEADFKAWIRENT